ncbi:acylamino-acid-releasing enzyme [Thraustotheca clavata]|uniref:acylaminoacyl-peptidase n=1 Tax=Thraustotheca clavata TaxID=74557 RepID=A0A1W0ABN2_9STRA|nr:acylamino-acid-releasing enzyme [Thraustotheca clavata]
MSSEYMTRASGLLQETETRQRILASGTLVSGEKDTLHAVLVWKQRDLINGTNGLSQVNHIISGENAVYRGLPVSYDSKVVSVSPSHKLRVIVTDAEEKTYRFSIYDHQKLVAVYHTTKELHGNLYTGPTDGSFVWSQDEKFIYYLAERKEKDGKPFWDNANKKPTDGDDGLRGTQYDRKPDWGEQNVGKRTSRIFRLDITSGVIDQVAGIPDDLTIAELEIHAHSNTLLFTGIETHRRLGLIYCYNRPKHVYTLPLVEGAVATKLVETTACATTRSAKVSPDGSLVAYLGTHDVPTHNTTSFLCVLDWATREQRIVIDVVDEPTDNHTAEPEKAFNGLYMNALLPRCWSEDSQFIYFNTEVGARYVWKRVNVTTSGIDSPSYVHGNSTGQEILLDRVNSTALIAVSTPVLPTAVYLVHLDEAFAVISRILLDDQAESTQIKSWSIESIPAQDIPGKEFSKLATSATPLLPTVVSSAPYDAIILLPSTPKPVDGFPVVLDLHGGPHGHSPAMYRAPYEYLCALGYAVVTVNYRGSTGYGRKALESLVGRVGTQDVGDCHLALLHVLDSHASELNARKVHVSGGSHGGFLGSHLIGQYPDFYRSAVLRNPVTNIASQIFTSDIPDWGLAVTGIGAFESLLATSTVQPVYDNANRLACLARMWEMSPMSNDLTKVKTPVLFGLGAKDLRVPSTEGLQLNDSLSHHGCKTRVLWYPEDCHPLDSVKTYADFAVNWALWLHEHGN